MLKSLRFAAVASVVLLVLTTSCSSTRLSQDASSSSNSQNSTTASAQTSSSSTTAEVALAMHLKQLGAKLYGAHWCPYCHKQKDLFGKEAFSQLDYIECDPGGKDARPDLCQQANVEGFPTWEIQGKKYGGLMSLQELANVSGYAGDRNFKD
jgi:glutaredoxin